MSTEITTAMRALDALYLARAPLEQSIPPVHASWVPVSRKPPTEGNLDLPMLLQHQAE